MLKFILATASLASVCLAQLAPKADKVPREVSLHGRTLHDDYFWLRERDNPAVLDLLRAERAYCDQVLAPTAARQEVLYKEMLARIQQADMSVPYRKGAWTYYTRTEEGKPYRIHCRKPYPETKNSPEQIIIDGNAAAKGNRNFRVGSIEISPDGTIAAIATDLGGAEKYTVTLRDLRANADLPEQLREVSGDFAWSADNRVLFYTTLDSAHRPDKVFLHRVGTDPSRDELVYHEKDEAFHVDVRLTRSERFVVITSAAKDTTECYVINARRPESAPVVIQPRQKGREYSVEHHENRFYIVTNDNAVNFRLVEAPVDSPGVDNWRELMSERPGVLLEGVMAFKNYLVTRYRQGGLPRLSVRSLNGHEREIPTPEPSYIIAPEINPEYSTKHFRYTYASPITPSSVYEIDMDSGESTLLKQQPVIGYDRSLYTVELEQVTTPDGQQVPLTVFYRKDTPRNGTAPALLNGYAAYGSSARPGFSSSAISLLDRGFVIAQAHCRGGSDKGRTWYLDGKLLKKKNSFNDFVSCAEFLHANLFAAADRLAIRGGSAGGLLVGAAVTMRPDLFSAVVAQVPFVDVVNTMLDPTLPLTVTEYDEWGNPGADVAAFDYMLSYSPYDNTRPAKYPSILLTGGLNDPRVSYWEPAKWAQKLRENNQAPTRILFKVELDAGHGGMADRFAALREEALVQAFLLETLKVPEPDPKAKKNKK